MDHAPPAKRRFGRLAALAALLVLVIPTGASAAEPAAESALERHEPLIPNIERPLTHAELLRVRGERTPDAGMGTRLVVADSIIRRPAPRPGRDRLTAGRGFGSLPRDRYPADPVVAVHRALSSAYPDAGDVAGLLAFEELYNDVLVFKGEVATPLGTYLTPIAAIETSAAAVPPPGLLVVRGSLRGERLTEPGSEDGGPSLDVDRDLYDRMDKPGELSEPATYLLGPSGRSDRWEVLGRLDAPSALIGPSETSAREVRVPSGLPWVPGLERQPPADTRWSVTTAWAGGFATIRTGLDRVLTAWASPDGASWEGAALPRPILSVSAILPLGDGLVLITDSRPFGRVWRYSAWRSDDGLRWRKAADVRVPTPARFERHRRVVQGYFAVGDRVLAIETYTRTPCCGRSPGSTFVAARDDAPDVTFTWSSRDGRRWTRQRTRGLATLAGGHVGHLIFPGDTELFALWKSPDHVIAHSTDGVDWKALGRYPRALDPYSKVLLIRTVDGIVLGGTVEEDAQMGGADAFVLWRSADGTGWRRTHQREDGRPTAIAAADGTVVVAGNDLDRRGPERDPPAERSWLMASDDAGRTWDPGLAWFAEDDWCLSTLTGDRGTIALEAACAPPDAASSYVTVGSGS